MAGDAIVRKRSDMSTYLVHWTTKDKFDHIVQQGCLIPSFAARDLGTYSNQEKKRNTIYGPRKAVCFTEMPIGSWIQSITTDWRYSNRRWGIAIPKRILYTYGARPVLYIRKPEPGQEPECPEEELWDRCPDEEKFRLCNFRYTSIPDWTHEREWRVCVNGEINEQINLKRPIVPVHLPSFTRGRPKDVLSDISQFVIIVESESDKESVRNPKELPKPIIEAIGKYHEKYLAVLQKAQVISLEHARDARDRLNLWSLEELLRWKKLQRISRIVTLWDKARTGTRRQVLDLIGEENGREYEYYRGRDLWSISPSLFAEHRSRVGERIEECEQAIEILRNDVRAWVHEVFEYAM